MATFQERLKELRKEKQLTMEQLSNELGTVKSTISRYENGTREPKKDFIEMLSSFFDVSFDYLLGKTDIRKPIIESDTKEPKENDIEKIIDELMEQQGLMLCGEPISEDDLFLLRNSIRSTIEMAKNMKRKK